jgi:predicted CoA-binding protein
MSQVRPVDQIIEDFLHEGPYAVVGASVHRYKYGNKVLRAYQQRSLEVYAVNPQAAEVEGLKSYPALTTLPKTPRGVSIITPPAVTEGVVEDAAQAGVRFLWMQPGAESPRAVDRARELGLEVIADGSCFLVVAGYRE